MAEVNEFHVVTADSADAVWFVGCLGTMVAQGAQTGGRLSIVEFTHPTGFATPQHVHNREDEGFYVLDGEMTGFCGDEEFHASRGSFVWLPSGVPHGYSSYGEATLRCLAITVPAGFEQFVSEAGEPAAQRVLPPPSEPDMPRLLAVHARYGLDVVGPPRHVQPRH